MQTCDLAIAKIKEGRRADLHSFTNPAKMSDHCTCQRKIAFNNFPFGDVLGSEGRKALNACVKVKIYGKPEVRRYNKCTASNRFYDCYVRQEGLRSPHVWIDFDENTKAYTIVDIHNALDKCDNLPYVEKYPKRETGSDEIRKLIDKRRADVEREWKEAKANPDGRQKYSLAVAQRRVKDCMQETFHRTNAYYVPLGNLSVLRTFMIQLMTLMKGVWKHAVTRIEACMSKSVNLELMWKPNVMNLMLLLALATNIPEKRHSNFCKNVTVV